MRENKISIEKKDSGFEVSLTIMDGELELMTIRFLVSDSLQASIVKENFLKDPSGLYQSILERLT